MNVRRWIGLWGALAATAAGCSDTESGAASGAPDGGSSVVADAGTTVNADAGDAGGADAGANTDAGGGAADAGSGNADAGADGGSGSADAGRADAGGGGTPTITVSEIAASPRSPYAGQLVRLSISLNGGQSPISWVQTAGPAGRFNQQSGTAVTWSSPGATTRTVYTIEARVSAAPAGTKSITFTIDPPTYTQVWTDILQPNCANCHGFIGSTAAAGYANLVGANHSGTAACSATGITKRVVAGNAQQSLLFAKVQGSQPVVCGGRMPSAAPALATGQIESIGAWITMGAPNN